MVKFQNPKVILHIVTDLPNQWLMSPDSTFKSGRQKDTYLRQKRSAVPDDRRLIVIVSSSRPADGWETDESASDRFPGGSESELAALRTFVAHKFGECFCWN